MLADRFDLRQQVQVFVNLWQTGAPSDQNHGIGLFLHLRRFLSATDPHAAFRQGHPYSQFLTTTTSNNANFVLLQLVVVQLCLASVALARRCATFPPHARIRIDLYQRTVSVEFNFGLVIPMLLVETP